MANTHPRWNPLRPAAGAAFLAIAVASVWTVAFSGPEEASARGHLIAVGGGPGGVSAACFSCHGLSMKVASSGGYCERFGCEHFAKASPETVILPRVFESPNFELRTLAHVTTVLLDEAGRRATAVLYVDAEGRELEQPAELVILCAFSLNNVKLMLNSGIGRAYDPATGEGTVGRNYTFQTMSAVTVFYGEDININPFMGAGALGTVIDDFNGDNFDHTGIGFVGGAYISANTTGGRPIEYHPTPPGAPLWGLGWKRAVRKHYNHTVGVGGHGSSMPVRGNYLSADPTYRDACGQPLLRMTFDFPDVALRH